MIINHENKAYQRKREQIGAGKWNGAYYYSMEITENIIPLIDTDRNWILVNVQGQAVDHSIVFIHNNLHPENYDWLKQYKDLVLVCGVPETVDKVKHLGHAIYVPISVDVDFVKQFKTDITKKGEAYIGRRVKMKHGELPSNIQVISGLPREELLKRMNKIETVYAVGRTAIEAKILGCKVKNFDERYPKGFKILDNKDAAKILQAELDKIDKPQEEKPKKTTKKKTTKKKTKKVKDNA